MDGWKMCFLLGKPIFRCYVSFREGTSIDSNNITMVVEKPTVHEPVYQCIWLRRIWVKIQSGCDAPDFFFVEKKGLKKSHERHHWRRNFTQQPEKTAKSKRTSRTGWSFQMFFIFTPIWGRFPFWLNGSKPPTRETQVLVNENLTKLKETEQTKRSLENWFVLWLKCLHIF